MAEPRMQTLRVLGGHAPTRSHRGPDDQGCPQSAPGHVVNLGGLVDDLVHGEGHEVAEHDLDDGAHSCHRQAHADAGYTRLGNRTIQYPLRSESVVEALGQLVDPTGTADVLTNQDDSFVARHLLMHRLIDGIGERYL